MNKWDNFSMKNVSASDKFSIEILNEGVKLMKIEKKFCTSTRRFNLIGTFRNLFHTIRIQNHVAEYFWTNFPLEIKNFDGDLIGKIRALVYREQRV